MTPSALTATAIHLACREDERIEGRESWLKGSPVVIVGLARGAERPLSLDDGHESGRGSHTEAGLDEMRNEMSIRNTDTANESLIRQVASR